MTVGRNSSRALFYVLLYWPMNWILSLFLSFFLSFFTPLREQFLRHSIGYLRNEQKKTLNGIKETSKQEKRRGEEERQVSSGLRKVEVFVHRRDKDPETLFPPPRLIVLSLFLFLHFPPPPSLGFIQEHSTLLRANFLQFSTFSPRRGSRHFVPSGVHRPRTPGHVNCR